MKSKSQNNAIFAACKQSQKNCCRVYVVERDEVYLLCTEDELFEDYDQDQVIGSAYMGTWE